MRFSFALTAFVALPALALPVEDRDVGISVHRDDGYDGHHHHGHHHHGYHHGHHNHGHHHHGHHHHKPWPHHHHHKHPHKQHHHHHQHHDHHRHGHVNDHALTDTCVCEKLNHLADKADHITHYVKSLECGYDDHCWKKVKDALYELEFELDIFDVKIDLSHLDKCFTCSQESKISCCYKTYAEALIRLLKLIKHKSSYLEGELDKYILTAINSLRAADSALVYELGRRLHCDEYLKAIMEKQGAVDGSTKGSIQEAFSKFVFTPLITGEQFKNKGQHHHQHHHDGEHRHPHHGHHHHGHHHHGHHHHGHHHHGHHHHHHKHPHHHHRPDPKLEKLEHKLEHELDYLKHHHD
ncbi:hypothetical protein BGZ63DRAFT_403999 [Mariannaea sp. PMI_226]|nr:hypothetical protein BGZ63DRAFT_403999 [Mariannaea sp. PMI_226]